MLSPVHSSPSSTSLFISIFIYFNTVKGYAVFFFFSSQSYLQLILSVYNIRAANVLTNYFSFFFFFIIVTYIVRLSSTIFNISSLRIFRVHLICFYSSLCSHCLLFQFLFSFNRVHVLDLYDSISYRKHLVNLFPHYFLTFHTLTTNISQIIEVVSFFFSFAVDVFCNCVYCNYRLFSFSLSLISFSKTCSNMYLSAILNSLQKQTYCLYRYTLFDSSFFRTVTRSSISKNPFITF